MKLRLVLLCLGAFLLALIVVLPARWAGGLLPDAARCNAWSGSVWNGSCNGLVVARGNQAALSLDQLRWRLEPLALLQLAARAQISATWPQGSASGRLERRAGGLLSVANLTAQMQLDRQLLAALPAGWHGRLQVQDFALAWDGNHIRALSGTVQALDLDDGRGGALGGYRFVFPAATAPPFTGQVNDTGNGPLELAATLLIEADRSWVLDGTVARRAGADPALDRRLDLLGPADASGRRRLSAAGSFH